MVQFFLSPLLLAPGFLPVVLSNLLFAASLSYYHYTQFLGYNGALLPAAGTPCQLPPDGSFSPRASAPVSGKN